MSWCDKLASTPSVGFRLDYQFMSGGAILDAFAPMLAKLADGEKQKFNIERLEASVAAYTTEDGFHYAVEPSKIHVAFRHSLKAKPISGGPPVMEMISRPLPFSELVPEVSEKLIEATSLLPGIKNRKVTRVGIVAATQVANEDLPPGIARFIKYVGRPWKGRVDAYSFQIVGALGEAPGWTDRCVHTLNRPEDAEQLVTLNFDWQRSFTTGRSTSRDSLEEIVSSAEKASSKYFEELAEGNQFDEDLISSAT